MPRIAGRTYAILLQLRLKAGHGFNALSLPPQKTPIIMASPNRRRLYAFYHIAMGLVLCGLAIPLVRSHKFGELDLGISTAYILAAVMVVYGLFRIWRGTADLRDSRADDDFIS